MPSYLHHPDPDAPLTDEFSIPSNEEIMEARISDMVYLGILGFVGVCVRRVDGLSA